MGFGLGFISDEMKGMNPRRIWGQVSSIFIVMHLAVNRQLVTITFIRYIPLFIGLLISCVNGPTRTPPAFEPANGQVMYISHQNTYQNDLDQLFGSDGQPAGPAGLIVYTSLAGGVSTKFIEGRTVEDLLPFFEVNPDISPILVLGIDKSLYGRLQEGEFDAGLTRLAMVVKSLKRPVYLTLGIEVNSPMYKNDPVKFVNAYKYCADKIKSFNVPNVSFVWYVVGMNPGYEERDVMEWYPGDEYVNWLGISIFKITDPHFAEKTQFTGPNYDRLLEVSRVHHLPIMILESSASTIVKDFDYNGETLWNFWYKPFFKFVEENDEVKAICHVTQEWVMDEVVWQKWKEKIRASRYLFSEGEAQP